MELFAYISFIAAGVYFYLGLYVLRKALHSELIHILSHLCFIWSVISFNYAISAFTYGTAAGRVTGIINSNIETLLAGFVYNFVIILCKKEDLIRRLWLRVLVFFPAAMMIFINVSSNILHKKISYPESIINKTGSVINGILLPLVILYFLIEFRRVTRLNREKKQLNMIFTTGFISFILIRMNLVLIQITHSPDYYFLPHIYVLIVATGICYIVVKYNFMEINSLISADDILPAVKDIIVILDTYGDIKNINNRAKELLGYSEKEIVSQPVGNITEPPLKKEQLERLIINHGCLYDNEMSYITQSGARLPVKVKITPVEDRFSDLAGYIAVAQDMSDYRLLQNEITERRISEEKLRFISHHDQLTGLFNRRFFEEQFQKFFDKGQYPISIVTCDIDGLKLINDTMGHDMGDKLLLTASHVIENACPPETFIARIGGDEFAVLIPYSNEIDVKRIVQRIREAIIKYNGTDHEFLLSISIGYAIAFDESKSRTDVYKEADGCMYSEKLHHSQSAKNALVKVLTKTLEARDFITEGHADRMQDMATLLAEYLDMSEADISSMRLLARFHDIGKVGVPDSILFKNGMLTQEEAEIMKRHSEIGYRIAQSSIDLVPIADFILKHHEWWNGKGYPLGLRENQIPLQARIISIIDAFDAMTNDRPYRKALTVERALGEINRGAGLQFDPNLVRVFLEMLTVKTNGSYGIKSQIFTGKDL